MGSAAFTLPNNFTPAKGMPFSRLAGHWSGRDVASEGSILLCLHDRLVPDLHSFGVLLPNGRPFITDAGMKPAAKMTLGQTSEVLFMLALPIFLKLYGIKTTPSWACRLVVRYAMFSFARRWCGLDDDRRHPAARYLLRLLRDRPDLHRQDRPPEIRSQAQGMLVFFTLGLGMFISALVAGKIEAAHTVMVEATEPGAEPGKMVEWASLWPGRPGWRRW